MSDILTIGDPAPEFVFTPPSGNPTSTTHLRGKPYIVYFYPKDNTPGCTKEACGFRDSYSSFQKAGVTVIGISSDSELSHEKFQKKHELPFALVSDPDRTIIEAYGAWGPKKFMGRTFDGILRITFLIDAEGKIAKIYKKIKPAEHAGNILQDIESLT